MCFFHDPAAAEKRTAAQRRGGQKGRATVLPANTPDFPLNDAGDASALLSVTINQLRRGQLDPKIATGLGYLLGLKMKAMDMAKLEKRVAGLEAALEQKSPAMTLFDEDDEFGGGL